MSQDQNHPVNWPSNVQYLVQPAHSSGLTAQQLQQLRTTHSEHTANSCLPIVRLPLASPTCVEIRCVKDPSHPANNQFGLFATYQLQPGSLVVPYLGLLHSNEASDTVADSNYDLSLDREAGVSVDAGRMGNEARMTNDYRGVPRPMSAIPRKKGEKLGPNAEFRDLWFEYGDGVIEKGIGIFVLSAGKSGKRSGGILQGEEVLVNYGKGFWKERMS